MAASYTYDAGKITENGRDRMRFELGDTIVDMGAITSPLSDEEYNAVIKMYPKWKKAKLECLRAITMKLSYEVDTSTEGLSYSLSQRAERWKEMLAEAKKENATGIPAFAKGSIYEKDEPHYFHTDMQSNPYKG